MSLTTQLNNGVLKFSIKDDYKNYELSLYNTKELLEIFKKTKVLAYGGGSVYLKVKDFLHEFDLEFDDILYTEDSKIVTTSGRTYNEIIKNSSILVCSSYYEEILKLVYTQKIHPNLIKIVSFSYKLEFFKRKILWLQDAGLDSLKIKDKEMTPIFLPKFNSIEKAISTISPDTYIYKLTNVFGTVDSSNFYGNEFVFIERMLNIDSRFCNYSTGNIWYHDSIEVTIRQKRNNYFDIEEPILFLGGNGSSNYFHWLIEILPKLLLIDKNILMSLGIRKIILSNNAKKINSFNDALNILLISKELDISIEYISELTAFKCKTLYYINNYNHTLINTKKAEYSPAYCTFSKPQLFKLRDIFLAKMKKVQSVPKKIFLLRKQESLASYNKRDYNESEIFSFFEKQGFVGLYVEDYDFTEQVYLFNNAEFIVGPSGAFWTNIIFCSIGTKAISWLPTNLKKFSVYSTLAKYVGVKMFFVETEIIGTTTTFHEPYILSKDKVIKTFQKIK